MLVNLPLTTYCHLRLLTTHLTTYHLRLTTYALLLTPNLSNPVEEKYGEIDEEDGDDDEPGVAVVRAHVFQVFAVGVDDTDDEHDHENYGENEVTLGDVFHENENAQNYSE